MNVMEQSHTTLYSYKALIVVAVAFLLAGCASTPRRIYSGEPLPDNQIVRISVEVKETSFLGRNPDQIYITHVDQQPLGSFWSGGSMNKIIDLIPGERSITVGLIGSGGALAVYLQTREAHQASGYGKVFKLNAQAGHKYIVKYIEKRLPLICWIEDEATGEVVSGEKPSEAKKVE